jgi:YVTN family beta-propeller protein
MGDISVTLAAPQVSVVGGTGAVTVSVTNVGPAPERVVLGVVRPGTSAGAPPADPAWAHVERALRELGPGATEQYVVSFATPAGTPAGTYEAKLVAHPADDAPEEYADRGQVLRLALAPTPPPTPPRPSRWWLWVVLAVVLLVAIGVVVRFLLGPDGGREREPASLAADTLAVGPFPAGVAVEPASGLVLVTNRDADTMSIVDPATSSVTGQVAVGPAPVGVAAEPVGGRIYVGNQGGATVQVVDLASGGVVGEVDVGLPPSGIAVDDERRVWVAVESGQLLLVDPQGAVILGSVVVGGNPRGVAWNAADGRLYVANQGSDSVSVVDPESRTVVATIGVGSRPAGVAVDPSDGTVYVTNVLGDSLSVVDPAVGDVVATLAVGINPSAVAVDEAARAVYVTNSDGTVSVVDTTTTEVIDTIGVGSTPTAVAVDPATGTVYVANAGDGTVTILRAG